MLTVVSCCEAALEHRTQHSLEPWPPFPSGALLPVGNWSCGLIHGVVIEQGSICLFPESVGNEFVWAALKTFSNIGKIP